MLDLRIESCQLIRPSQPISHSCVILSGSERFPHAVREWSARFLLRIANRDFFAHPELTIAATSPGMVYSLASMSTGKPNSRNVAEVTGPIDAVCTPWRRAGVSSRRARALRSPSNSTKFFTVEELVKVIACGLRVRRRARLRSRFLDDFRYDRLVRLDHINLCAGLA